ncbi:hypothetical protein P7H12_00010 [Paenibacillus larvae]|nr:hypothetical protein [Paenibacillus larvae]MDT2262356.1 hypothetical protein [Paenibacillus larvae]
MTMQISLVTSPNDALIKRAGLEYDIKTLEETQQRLRSVFELPYVCHDQLIKRKKDELGARREADRQRKRKASKKSLDAVGPKREALDLDRRHTTSLLKLRWHKSD